MTDCPTCKEKDARIAELVSALVKYGRHQRGCRLRVGGRALKCGWGYSNAIAKEKPG